MHGLLHRPHVAFSVSEDAPQRWTEAPMPAVTLIVSMRGGLRADGAALPSAWVGGLTDRAAAVEMDGVYDCVDVKLTPLGAYRVLGRPLDTLAGQTVALADLLGGDGRRLEEAMAGAADAPGRFALVDALLARRFDAGPHPSPAVAWAYARLRDTDGRVGVEALAREVGWSRRHFGVRFRREVGLPPKTVARLLRFDRVRRLIDARPARWADIAYDCGYADQSHLNRDFRDLAGTTPTRFLAERLEAGYSAAYGS